MAEFDRSHMTPVCAGSFLTAMKYERSVECGHSRSGGSKYTCKDVIFLCEYSSLSSPLSAGISFHLIIPLLTCTSIHCTLFHVLYYG